MSFMIRAGITGSAIHGTRSTPLKEKGQIKEYATAAEAEADAAELNKSMNGPYARAFYRYTVEPTTPLTLEQKLEAIVEATEEALGAALVAHFPEATTGDVDPMVSMEFQAMTTRVVMDWLRWNVPAIEVTVE